MKKERLSPAAHWFFMSSLVTFMPKKASAPAAPSPGFSNPIPLFEDPFFSFAASAFFSSPSPSKCYIASLPLFTL